MDRFHINDSNKDLMYNGALEFIGEVRAGISWERFCTYTIYYSEALVDMLKDTEGVREFLSSKKIDKKYVSENIKEIFYRLHFNRDNNRYLTLALPHDATQKLIHKRWKDFMVIYHPDRNRESGKYMAECAKKINEAYSSLKEHAKRTGYERSIEGPDRIHLNNKYRKPKLIKSKRCLLVSPPVKRVIPKVITLSSIVITSLVLLTIFFENRLSQFRIYQPSVHKTAPSATKEFKSKTTFLSFPGLTGPECFRDRKTLDARLSLSPQVVSGETSGMTYKDVVCDVTNDRISNSKEEMRTGNDKTLVNLFSQTKDKQYEAKSQKLHGNSRQFRKHKTNDSKATPMQEGYTTGLSIEDGSLEIMEVDHDRR